MSNIAHLSGQHPEDTTTQQFQSKLETSNEEQQNKPIQCQQDRHSLANRLLGIGISERELLGLSQARVARQE
jgi:hypothetical protein